MEGGGAVIGKADDLDGSKREKREIERGWEREGGGGGGRDGGENREGWLNPKRGDC